MTKLVSFVPIVLAGGAFYLCWRSRRRWGWPVLLGLGIYLVTLFPALGFFDSQFLTRWQVSDHLQYLPMVFPVAIAAAGLALLLPPKVFRAVAAALVLGLTCLTFQRAQAFAAPEKLFRDTLAKNPAAWAAHNDLGTILATQNNLPGAIEQFMDSLDSNPDNNPDAHANLAQALALQGQFAQAESHFREALRLEPLNAQTLQNFGSVLGQEGKSAEAERQLRAALSLRPDPETHLALAAVFLQFGDVRRARDEYRVVLARQPDNVPALNNLALILASASDDDMRDGPEAVRLAERALRLPPVPGLCVSGTLAAAYAETGRFPEAIATAEQAVRDETAAGQTRFADLNTQLLSLYRAHQPWHGTLVRHAAHFGINAQSP